MGRMGPRSPSTSPQPITTRIHKAVTVLFQSRTKVSFILPRVETFSFAMSVCAQTGSLYVFSQSTSIHGKPKAGDCFITWLSLTSGKEVISGTSGNPITQPNMMMAWSLAHAAEQTSSIEKSKTKMYFQTFHINFSPNSAGSEFWLKVYHSHLPSYLSPVCGC